MSKTALACIVGIATSAFGQIPAGEPPACGRSLTSEAILGMGARLYPELRTDTSRSPYLTVGLLFDNDCRLIKHVSARRRWERLPTHEAMAVLMPNTRLNPWIVSGVAGIRDSLISPRVVYLVLAAASEQYRSPAGVRYRSQADTGTVVRAQQAVDADPRNVTKIIALGVAQSGVRQMREAIETFSRGLGVEPNNALLLRWRGHRYLSTRQFDLAAADFARGARIDSTIYGIWYHWGIVRFAAGDFAGAADAFRRGIPKAPDAGELAGSVDWLWMSLARAGKRAEADAMLAKRPDSLPTTVAYAQRLKLYRGLVKPDSVFTPTDTADVQVATLSFGIGNWYLVNGDTARARPWFERSVASGGWPGFGFILSEIELRRLAARR
jgi:tetratricopeptide (TPR) repeat protein